MRIPAGNQQHLLCLSVFEFPGDSARPESFLSVRGYSIFSARSSDFYALPACCVCMGQTIWADAKGKQRTGSFLSPVLFRSILSDNRCFHRVCSTSEKLYQKAFTSLQRAFMSAASQRISSITVFNGCIPIAS